jgi:hypothetical protein
MKLSLVLILLVSGFSLAEDFSIYPLTPKPLGFSTRLEPLFDSEEYTLEFPSASLDLEPFSMQYVYPDEAKSSYTISLA